MKFIIDFDIPKTDYTEKGLAEQKRFIPGAVRGAIAAFVESQALGYSWVNHCFDITPYEDYQPEPDKYDVAIEMRMATELGKLHNDYAGLQNRHAHLLVEMAQLKRELANLKCKRANG